MEYWYLWVIFAILCIATVIVSVFAGRASKAHNRLKEAELAELKRLTALKEKFSTLDVDKVQNSDASTLFEGVYTVLVAKLEKSENPEETFKALSLPQQTIYTLFCFLKDCKAENISLFFTSNEALLTDRITPALLSIGETELAALAKAILENDKTQEEANTWFDAHFNKVKFLENIRAYILKNISAF